MRPRSNRFFALVASLFIFGAGMAVADAQGVRPDPAGSASAGKAHGKDKGKDHPGKGGGHKRGHAVPELDTSVAASAAVLLIGGVFVILGRRRRSAQV